MSEPTLLVVDDEPNIRRVLELSLGDAGYRVLTASTAAQASRLLAAERVDLLLTDLQLPDRSGLELLDEVRAARADLPVILITAYGTVESAVQAIRAGAFDYVMKPFRVEEIEALVQRALGLTRAERENAYLREVAAPEFEGMVAESPGMRGVVRAVEQVAAAPTTVLVTGETGSGKELVARAIHACSHRAEGPFVAVNCSAIPETLLEAEFFGAKKGSYTGATADREGYFQAARGGTLFLDEIGDLPLPMQSKLLRAIQERQVRALGSTQEDAVDVRIVSATHRDLGADVQAGRFRQDLLYRINTVELHVPQVGESTCGESAHEVEGRAARRKCLTPSSKSLPRRSAQRSRADQRSRDGPCAYPQATQE